MSEPCRIRVRDVMKTKYDLVEESITVKEALTTMELVKTKCLIINKHHVDDEYGIVVIADIARHVLVKNRAPERVSLYEIMTKPAVSVPPGMQIRHACSLFAQLGLTRAPVVDRDGKIIGVVSYTDMVIKGLTKAT